MVASAAISLNRLNDVERLNVQTFKVIQIWEFWISRMSDDDECCLPLPQSWMDILVEESDHRAVQRSTKQCTRSRRVCDRANAFVKTLRSRRDKRKTRSRRRGKSRPVDRVTIDARISKSILEIEDLLSVSPFRKGEALYRKKMKIIPKTKLPQCINKIHSYVASFNQTMSNFDRLYRHFSNDHHTKQDGLKE